uniref:Ig-like domain-containing protein n=1 Tax=Plectus sambesii TaxID=2011161 RepID=A0A914XD87_9BILA
MSEPSLLFQVVWMKDGEKVKTSTQMKLSFTDNGWCSLAIYSCTSADTGLYLCSARNDVGVETTQAMLTVLEETIPVTPIEKVRSKEPTKGKAVTIASDAKGTDQASKPKFIRAPGQTMEVAEGESVQLVCKAVGPPKPAIKWLKDGKEIPRTSRSYDMRLTGEGEATLSIDCAIQKSAGRFTCVAENTEGTATVDTLLYVLPHSTGKKVPEAPSFTVELKDVGLPVGSAAELRCSVRGQPEPKLKWLFVDAKGHSQTVSAEKWLECRRGEACELRSDVISAEMQGLYQCVASNEHGQVVTACYLLVGAPTDAPACPPSFVRCLRDIWTPLNETVQFECEVAGNPRPTLTWFRGEEQLTEGKNTEVNFVSNYVCTLTVRNVHLADLGTYMVEAANEHGRVRTAGAINVGKQRHGRPPVFLQGLEDRTIAISAAIAPSVVTKQEHLASSSKETAEKAERMTQSMEAKDRPRRGHHGVEHAKKGAAPSFVFGLEDMDLKLGERAAVAGKLARRKKHGHHHEETTEATGLAQAVRAAHEEGRMEPPVMHVEERSKTLDEIRSAIAARNAHKCLPKFMVKPKSHKALEEFKSLRLKTAVSANPPSNVQWDKNGVILETGNKYSIYNDGDFYYLEVHHVSDCDTGFYNCTAINPDGMAVVTSEVDVIRTETTSLTQLRRRSRKEPRAPHFIEVLPGKLEALVGEPLTVECSVSAYPTPAITWLRDKSVLMPQPGLTMLYDGECATLKFAQLTLGDGARYTCLAKNQSGEAKTTLRLDVKETKNEKSGEAPKFKRRTMKDQTITDGDTVTFVVELVEGTDPVEVQWTHGGVEVQDSTSFKYKRAGKKYSLVIADAFPEDAGPYACVATNQYGKAECTVNLIVQEKMLKTEPPKIVEAPKMVMVEPGQSAEITVAVTGHPEPVIE